MWLEMENKWFKAKIYGYGWYPYTWQGWLCIIIWAILFVIGMKIFTQNWLINVIFNTSITLVLIYISYIKGEKARWRWGK